jgi:hypothetical protein
MHCLDGTECYYAPLPPCCNDVGIVELVVRCNGDTGCIRYYSNTSVIYPQFAPDTVSMDSLMNLFVFGMQGSFAMLILPVAGLVAILIVIAIISYSVSKS